MAEWQTPFVVAHGTADLFASTFSFLQTLLAEVAALRQAQDRSLIYTSVDRSFVFIAEVAEWQTRTTQNRVPQGVRVRVPPSAPEKTTSRPGRTLDLRKEGREVYPERRRAKRGGDEGSPSFGAIPRQARDDAERTQYRYSQDPSPAAKRSSQFFRVRRVS